MIINKDFIYLICFLIIICNTIIYNKNELPRYSYSKTFRILLLSLCVFIIFENIYIGLFLAMTYLIINDKNIS